MARSPNDDRSDSMNPNNRAYADSMDNRSNQLNPNNDSYWSCRGEGHLKSDDDDDLSPYLPAISLSNAAPMQSHTTHKREVIQPDVFEVPLRMFLDTIYVDRHFRCRRIRVRITCDQFGENCLQRYRNEISEAWRKSSLWHIRISYSFELGPSGGLFLEETRPLESVSSPIRESVMTSVKVVNDFLAGKFELHYLHLPSITYEFTQFMQTVLESDCP